jgi:hypothetical protein
MAAALTVAPMFGTSAFAESRHQRATRDGGSSRQSAQRDEHRSAPTHNDRHDTSVRSDRGTRNDGTRHEAFRNDGIRHDGFRNDVRQSVRFDGRVNRIERFRGGYHVWVGGGRFPLFIPEVRFRSFPIRVGLNVRLGGYWDPLGYYNVADDSASAGLRGVVESVDYRSGTLVVRDNASGSFVTTVLVGNDPRLNGLRPGDYVELNGSWSRAGVFEAYNVADLRARY